MISVKKEAMKTARLEKGLSCAQLAELARVSPSTVCRIERGLPAIPASAKAISDALEKPILELFEIKE